MRRTKYGISSVIWLVQHRTSYDLISNFWQMQHIAGLCLICGLQGHLHLSHSTIYKPDTTYLFLPQYKTLYSCWQIACCWLELIVQAYQDPFEVLTVLLLSILCYLPTGWASYLSHYLCLYEKESTRPKIEIWGTHWIPHSIWLGTIKDHILSPVLKPIMDLSSGIIHRIYFHFQRIFNWIYFWVDMY